MEITTSFDGGVAQPMEMSDDTVTFVQGQIQGRNQDAFARRADQLSRWIKALATLAAVYGVALLFWCFGNRHYDLQQEHPGGSFHARYNLKDTELYV